MKKDLDQQGSKKYLLFCGQYVGNCMLFWGKNNRGYTTNIDKAHVYTRKEVKGVLNSLGPERFDTAIERDEALAKTMRVVDGQHLSREMFLKKEDL